MERALSVIWGTDIHEDVFQRWKQGFIFSSKEPLALVQYSGGPCAVLAPVQAFILQKHLYENRLDDSDLESSDWKNCTDSSVHNLLLLALSHILKQASTNGSCKIAVLSDKTLNYQNLPGTETIERATPTTKIGTTSTSRTNTEIGLKRKHPSSLTDPSEEGFSSKRDSMSGDSPMQYESITMATTELIPQGAIESLMRRAEDDRQRSRTHESGRGKVTLDLLSSALSNINRSDSENPSSSTCHNESGCDQPRVTQDFLSSTLSNVKNTETSIINSESSADQKISQAPPTTNLTLPLFTSVTTPPSTSFQVVDRTSKKGLRTDSSQLFHLNTRICDCPDETSTIKCLQHNMGDWKGPFGVLLFLYSIVLTKGVDKILEEREEAEQPLIDPLHGHGSQSLINLLLVGRAVTNVFDLDKDLGGIKLQGIPQQSSVGFLTILEALRYCEVGSFLKDPLHPVWLIGSETHLTVLFSTETNLTSSDDSQTVAKREFASFDQEGSGFIATSLLGELLKKLDLETDSDYVHYMESRLDPEKIGIILLENFLKEFFPYPMEVDKPKAFPLYHYNGLQPAATRNEVQFVQGSAVILGEEGGTSTETSLLNCLHTKWPALIVHWDCQTEPKII